MRSVLRDLCGDVVGGLGNLLALVSVIVILAALVFGVNALADALGITGGDSGGGSEPALCPSKSGSMVPC